MDNMELEEVSFDFLVKGHLLRMALDKLISRLALSTEDVITVEYFPAVSVSDESLSCDMPAWVSCLSTGLIKSHNGILVTGCYDGFIRLTESSVQDDNLVSLSNTSSTIATMPQHEGPIKDLQTFSYHDHSFIISCGKDHAVKCFMATSTGNNSGSKKKDKASVSFNQVASLNGHLSSVNCVDVCSSSKQVQVVSADWEGNVLSYQLHEEIEKVLSTPAISNNSKKSKLNSGESQASGYELRNISSSSLIHAHSQAITGIQLFNSEATGEVASRMITGSHDHSLKIWDLEHQDNILTYNTSKVITSLHYSDVNKLILTSHPDDKIRLYDSRQSVVTNSESHLNNQSCLKTFYSSTSLNSSFPPQWIAQVSKVFVSMFGFGLLFIVR